MMSQFGTLNRTTHCAKRRRTLYENSSVLWKVEDAVSENQWLPVSIDKFEQINKIGEGTYGAVYRAKAPSGKYVALKRIRMENEKEGFPITAIREIKILKALDHPNILPLLDVVTSSAQLDNWSSSSKRQKTGDKNADPEIYMVFEYLDHDLAGIMRNHEVTLQEKHIKYYVRSILEALYYIHEKCNVLHRDIKGSNVLINNDGKVKLADFGLSRQFHPDENRDYTNRVVTLWYRAPELLLGLKKYSSPIDMWSLGCVFAELVFGKPTFPGETELAQIDLICQLVGSPTEESYKGCSKFPVQLKKRYPRNLAQRWRKLKTQCPLAYDLLDKLLVLDPSKRLSAVKALDHEFFQALPHAEKAPLDSILPSHDYETTKREQERKARRQRSTHTSHASRGENRTSHGGAGGGGGGGGGGYRDRRDSRSSRDNSGRTRERDHRDRNRSHHNNYAGGSHQSREEGRYSESQDFRSRSAGRHGGRSHAADIY
uniref:Cyclin-dependent kinase C-1 n=1 Tax=Hirondellea gigas TaxID=1518452 RepID=A0A6A7G8S3_9CRUS